MRSLPAPGALLRLTLAIHTAALVLSASSVYGQAYYPSAGWQAAYPQARYPQNCVQPQPMYYPPPGYCPQGQPQMMPVPVKPQQAPSTPATPSTPTTPSTPSTQSSQQQPESQPSTADQNLSPSDADMGGERSGAAGGETVATATPNMMGDLLVPSGGCRFPRSRISSLSGSSSSSGGSFQGGYSSSSQSSSRPKIRISTRQLKCSDGRIPSSSHSFKVADNNNALPQSRIFANYSYFNDVNRGFNKANGLPGSMDVHQEVFGFERAFADGNASFSMSMPLNTLVDPDVVGTTVGVGNLTMVGKMVIYEDDDYDGDFLVSTGMGVTVPTGPNGFAGAAVPFGVNDVTLQPYLALVYRAGPWYVIGFSSVDVPIDARDAVLWYNDVSVSYYIQTPGALNGRLTAVVPTVELHINTASTHRSDGTLLDPASTPDWIDITTGATLMLGRYTSLALGASLPVTGPLPYRVEGMAQLNLRF